MNAPIVYVDTRSVLPSFAWSAVRLSAAISETVLIKPTHLADPVIAGLKIVDPRSVAGANDAVNAFRGVYRHLSTAPVSYERACFERYLVAWLYVAERGLDGIWHFDTDVVPGRDLASLEVAQVVGQFDAIVAQAPSKDFQFGDPTIAGLAYLKQHVLEAFATFLLMDFYQSYAAEAEAFFEARRRAGLTGGVCDMTAWGCFLHSKPEWRVFDTQRESIHGQAIINHLYALERPDQGVPPALEQPGDGPFVFRYDEGLMSLHRQSNGVAILAAHFSGADHDFINSLEGSWRLRIGGLQHRMRRARFRLNRKFQTLIQAKRDR